MSKIFLDKLHKLLKAHGATKNTPEPPSVAGKTLHGSYSCAVVVAIHAWVIAELYNYGNGIGNYSREQ